MADDAILAQGVDGSDLLHFCTRIGPKNITFRYPRWGQRVAYSQAVYAILNQLSAMDRYELGDLSGEQIKSPFGWAEIASVVLSDVNIWDSIEAAFYEFLQPEIDGLSREEIPKYIAEYASMDWPIRCLLALLTPMEAVKKNARYAATLLHQA